MTNKEIINEIISNYFNSISLNTKTNKIELDNEEMLSCDYDNILDKCKNEYPDTKFTKTLIKDIVTKYAREHKYTSEEEKKKVLNPIGKEWKDDLKFNKKGEVERNIINTLLFFNNDISYKDKFSYNDFTKIENYDKKEIQDYMVEYFRLSLENELGYNTKELVESCIKILTHNSTYHPFKEKIEAITWDGKERAETLFIKFIGAYDTELNKKMTRNWLYGMIKRIYEPGCPFDYMLIAYDPKGGTGKSKIVERLVEVICKDYGYSSSITCNVSDKDNVDKLNRCVVVAFEELADFDKKELPQVKTFISTRYDTARLSYDKRSSTYQRHCVFYGNSNEELFLNDYSSPNECERRFWVMECDGDNTRDESWWRENLTDEYLLQVWAEIYSWYVNDKNMSVTLNIKEREELLKIQNKHKKILFEDVSQNKINNILNGLYSLNDKDEFDTEQNCYSQFSKILSGDIYTSGRYINRIPVIWLKTYIKDSLKTNLTTQKITFLLSEEWEYKVARYNGKVLNCYVRRNLKEKIEETNTSTNGDTLPF